MKYYNIVISYSYYVYFFLCFIITSCSVTTVIYISAITICLLLIFLWNILQLPTFLFLLLYLLLLWLILFFYFYNKHIFLPQLLYSISSTCTNIYTVTIIITYIYIFTGFTCLISGTLQLCLTILQRWSGLWK